MSKLIRKSINIKEMENKDKEVVRQLLVESYSQYKGLFEKERWKNYEVELRESVENKKINKLYIAIYEEEIVGTLQLFRNSDDAYGIPELQIEDPIIRFLAVHPKGRGLGIAKQLLDVAVTYAQSQKAQATYLHTTDIMECAIKLYEKYGFIRDELHDFKKNNNTIKCYKFII